MALELAKHNPTYEDIASKFFEHFLFISDAMTFEGPLDSSLSLWNEEDGFYYDAISWGSGHSQQIPVHSLVGLIPLYATLTLEPTTIKRFPGFKKRMDWFLEHRVEMSQRNIANMKVPGKADRRLLSLVDKDRLVRILERMLDETEFLSEYGIRSLSLYHEKNPWEMDVNGEKYCIGYWPGDSKSGMFGGNSNWRGPIWLAVNFLVRPSRRGGGREREEARQARRDTASLGCCASSSCCWRPSSGWRLTFTPLFPFSSSSSPCSASTSSTATRSWSSAPRVRATT
jgi:hypothetical protein